MPISLAQHLSPAIERGKQQRERQTSDTQPRANHSEPASCDARHSLQAGFAWAADLQIDDTHPSSTSTISVGS